MKKYLPLIFILSVSLHITNRLSCWVLFRRNKRCTASYFWWGEKSPPLPCYMEGHNCHVWPCHVRAYKDIISHCTKCFEGTGWRISLGNNVSADKTCVPVCSFPWGCVYGSRYFLIPFVSHSEKPPTAANPGKIDEAPTAFVLQLGDWGQHGWGGNPSGKGGGELCRSDCVEPSHCNSAYIIQACWWEKGGGARDCLAGFNNRWKFEESRGPSEKV